VAEEYGHNARILLVEDYFTNQQIAVRHLKTAGYRVDLASDGQQAVSAYRQNNYDLILMDIEMPLMDGFEATRAIREAEDMMVQEHTLCLPSDHNRRTPIIAMTAHAVEGFQERCLKAGMDDCITKPLRRYELLAMVAKWIAPQGTRPAQGKALPAAEAFELRDQAPMDFETALEEFMNDRQFLMGVAEDFLNKVRGQITTIRQALAEGDAEEVRTQAHAIKGGACNLTASELAAAARELEDMGTAGTLEQGPKKLERLNEAYHRLEQFMRLHRNLPGAARA
jgi:CheY-like chemotaxis protein